MSNTGAVSSKGYSVLKADVAAQQRDIVGVGKRNLDVMSDARYVWNYLGSPCGKAQAWLARDDGQGTIVGSGAVFPRRIVVDGRVMLAGVAGDFAVDKVHRAYGPALKMQRAIQTDMTKVGFAFIYGLPNALSEPIFRRVGYSEVGHLQRFTKVLRSEYLISRYVRPRFAARVLSKPIDWAMALRSPETWQRKRGAFSRASQKNFDRRFDELWQRSSGLFRVAGERSSAFLKWRYNDCPDRDYRVMVLLGEAGRIEGYVVFHTEGDQSYISDIVFSDRGPVLNALFCEFMREMRRRGVASVSIWYLGSGAFIDYLRRWGFRPREAGAKMLLYCPPGSAIRDLVLNREHWHFLFGDSDT